MPDMSAEVPTGPKPEQGLNAQSEKDPRSFVTFIYRGDNPYMRFLVNGFKARSIPTIVREVSRDEFDKYANDSKQLSEEQKEASLKSLIGPLQGVVVSDATFNTIFHYFLKTSTPFGHPEVNAYDALQWDQGGEQGVVAALGPVVEQIKAAGKKPVALRENLGDHVRFHAGPGEIKAATADDYAENQSKYATILNGSFDVPAIDSSRTILHSLKEMGISPRDTVLLIDHHIDRTWQRAGIDTLSLGKNGIELTLVCPCCLELNAPRRPGEEGSLTAYQPKFEKLGFKFFPLDKPEPGNEITDRLINMVEEKRPEVPAEETQDESVELTQNEPGSDTKPISEEPNPAPMIEPQAEKERISFLRRALARFGGKK